jgi:hypothetical protein
MNLDDHEIQESLRQAGIPREYHSPTASLGNFGKAGEALAQWVKTEGPLEVLLGRGKVIVGRKVESLDLFYTLARSLMIVGTGVWVLPLVVAIKHMWTEEFQDKEADTPALFITGFYNDHYKAPFTEQERYGLEQWATQRMKRQQALFLQATSPKCDWFSPFFLQLVAQSNGDPIIIA